MQTGSSGGALHGHSGGEEHPLKTSLLPISSAANIGAKLIFSHVNFLRKSYLREIFLSVVETSGLRGLII